MAQRGGPRIPRFAYLCPRRRAADARPARGSWPSAEGPDTHPRNGDPMKGGTPYEGFRAVHPGGPKTARRDPPAIRPAKRKAMQRPQSHVVLRPVAPDARVRGRPDLPPRPYHRAPACVAHVPPAPTRPAMAQRRAAAGLGKKRAHKGPEGKAKTRPVGARARLMRTPRSA
jgi:hypothetical protein